MTFPLIITSESFEIVRVELRDPASIIHIRARDTVEDRLVDLLRPLSTTGRESLIRDVLERLETGTDRSD